MSFSAQSVTEFARTQLNRGRIEALPKAIDMELHLLSSCCEIVHHLMLVWLHTRDTPTHSHTHTDYLFIFLINVFKENTKINQ